MGVGEESVGRMGQLRGRGDQFVNEVLAPQFMFFTSLSL